MPLMRAAGNSTLSINLKLTISTLLHSNHLSNQDYPDYLLPGQHGAEGMSSQSLILA
jgi:hypothetical protein